MGARKYSPEDYELLTYYRWKALIRSDAYQKFYHQVKELIKELEELEDEIGSLEHEIVTIEDDGTIDAPSLDEFIRSCEEGERIPENILHLKEQAEELEDEKEAIEQSIDEAIIEARDRFKLLVFNQYDLEPLDKPLEKLCIAFLDYLPLEQGTFKKMHEDFAAKEIAPENIKECRHRNLKLFCIDPSWPIGLIISSIKRKVRNPSVMVKKRKEYANWEEALKVWDFWVELTSSGIISGKGYLETGNKMGWYANNNISEENIRDKVRKKLKKAQELMGLASQGIFYKP